MACFPKSATGYGKGTAAYRLICLVIGAVLLGTAFGSLALTLDAAKARIRTIGSPVAGGWNLFSPGEVGDYVLFPAATNYQARVRAWGSPCQGTWPEMALLLDGEQMGQLRVGDRQAKDYEFRLGVTAGAHTLTVAFLNDAMSNGEDRNLYLGTIELLPLTGSAEPTLATPEQVAADGQRQEDRILAESDAEIERTRKGDALIRVVDGQGRPVNGAKVMIEQVGHEFLFGCNIFGFDQFKTEAQNEQYQRRFADLFNYATVGFYWKWYESERGKPRYAYTDKVVAWCAEHEIRLKGHPLLWADEAGIPPWSKGQPSPDLQRARVTEIMGLYQGKIEFWEVVNEPSHLPSLNIDAPYRWAREADPRATLIVNDYYVMADGHPPFFRLLQEAIAKGVPFDGIGIQAHEPRTMRFPLERVKRTLEKYATLGKSLNITEFTPASSGEPITGSHVKGVWDEAAQADYAVKFYRVCFAHPKMVALTWWDLCDTHSWLKGGGMLRSDLTPKPVYTALQKLIREQWHTRRAGVTDQAGAFPIRGFYGRYEAQVEDGTRKTTATFHLDRDGQKAIVLRLP